MPKNNKDNKNRKTLHTSKAMIFLIIFIVFFFSMMFFSSNRFKQTEISYNQLIEYSKGVYFVNTGSKNDKVFEEAVLEKKDEQFLFFILKSNKKRVMIPLGDKEDYSLAKKINSIEVQEELIEGILISRDRYNGEFKDKNFYSVLPKTGYRLLNSLLKDDVNVSIKKQEGETLVSILLGFLPWVIGFFLIWIFLSRNIQNSQGKALSFGRSRAKLYQPSDGKRYTFNDVAGVDEAKEEVQEIVDFLKEPEKFKKIGARIPKGVLLVGPPGTGKTLLARAIAGEANCPFYTVSGSDFVEMFVGVGASRVRDLFETAKKNSPCLIFIDELDAVGRMRGAGLGGSNDEREQTLNQILVEMDGFDQKKTIIIIGATNRPDVLDTALLRPGRFDRQVMVDLPDFKGRKQILKIHAKNKPLQKEVDLEIIARGTPGFSGADLENILNEAALLAGRKNADSIDLQDLEESIDRKMMGPQRKSRIMKESEKESTAYHEAGHTLVAHYLEETDPIHKVTIIPRGRSLGLTKQLPLEDRFSINKRFLLNRISILMGGRIAEKIKYGDDFVTTGASHDISVATETAHALVTHFGMTDRMGMVNYGNEQTQLFIGKHLMNDKNYSDVTAREIDEEIKRIADEQYKVAQDLIEKYWDKLEALTHQLIEKETLEKSEIIEIFNA